MRKLCCLFMVRILIQLLFQRNINEEIYITSKTMFISSTYRINILILAMSDAHLGRMPQHPTGANHYHAHLGLPDRGHVVKGLVFCHVVWLGFIIYKMGLWTSVVRGFGNLVVVRMFIELKQHNTQQIHADIINTIEYIVQYYYNLCVCVLSVYQENYFVFL